MICNKNISIRAGGMAQVKVPFPLSVPGDPKRRIMDKGGEFIRLFFSGRYYS